MSTSASAPARMAASRTFADSDNSAGRDDTCVSEEGAETIGLSVVLPLKKDNFADLLMVIFFLS